MSDSMISPKRPVVLVTGVFDLLHTEHIKFLKKAKALGGDLIIGVESDERVRQMKGAGRPIQSAGQRVRQILALKLTDKVVVLPIEFHLPQQHQQFLEQVKPDILAVSSHTPHLEQKRQLMAKIGGRVIVVHEHNPKISTTKQIEHVIGCRQ